MTREIAGLLSHIHSPSHYELIHNDSADRVHVFFTGKAWAVRYVFPSGQTFHRVFRTRDDAFSVLSLARDCA